MQCHAVSRFKDRITIVYALFQVTLSSENFSTLRLRTTRLERYEWEHRIWSYTCPFLYWSLTHTCSILYYFRMRYLLISSVVTALLAWGVAVSSWMFIAAATLIILAICGCVAMATKLVSCMCLGPCIGTLTGYSLLHYSSCNV